jgi:hypothetical protein
MMDEREFVVAYLRDTADFWKRRAAGLYPNSAIGAAMAEAKAGVLDAVATDVQNGLHRRAVG